MTQQATTPFLATSASAMLGLGAPIVQVYDVTALTVAGPTTITLTWPNPITKGRLRIKSSGVNAVSTIALAGLTGSDGTNTVLLKPALEPATAAGQNFDNSWEIISDLQLTSLSFAATIGGATTTATINSEFFANP
jgi:hypothetical protein